MPFETYATTSIKHQLLYAPYSTQAYYVDYLKLWMDVFPREQLLVLSYDEMKEDPSMTEWRIEQFLGFKLPGELPHSNVRVKAGEESGGVPDVVKQVLDPIVREKNEELYQLLEHFPGPYMEQRPFPRFQ